MNAIFFVALLALQAPDDPSGQLTAVKRVYVDRLTGGETAADSANTDSMVMGNSS